MRKLIFALMFLMTACGNSRIDSTGLRNHFPAQPGAVQQFSVIIYNNTQWSLIPSINNNGASLTIPSGGKWVYTFDTLQPAVSVVCYTDHLPHYYYPTKVLIYGRDYEDTKFVNVGFP